MMRAWVSVLAGVSLVTVPQSGALAQAAKVYTPDSAWAVDYGDNYCRLLRDFKNGADTVSLVVERMHPSNSVRILVIGDSLKTFRGANEITYRMLPSGANRTAQKLAGTATTGQAMLNLGSTSIIDIAPPSPPAPGAAPSGPPAYNAEREAAQAAAFTGILLEKGMSNPVQLETGSLEGPVKALQACADDLLGTWGLDAAKHKTATRRAAPATPASGWLPEGTIPFTEFAKLSGGNNELRVMVDAAGKPTSCHVQWPSLSASLNDTICKAVVANGSFTPAQDASGQAMPSYWATSVFSFMAAPRGRR